MSDLSLSQTPDSGYTSKSPLAGIANGGTGPSDPDQAQLQPPQQDKHERPKSPFRALPLLSTDLHRITINVSHAFVRPNDRGKEVLSFMVEVNPGGGKDVWKVEKMYSDVLSLDQRVRKSVGKGVGKKIANLPKGKLWKSRAPAKVDRRKVSITIGVRASTAQLNAGRSSKLPSNSDRTTGEE